MIEINLLPENLRVSKQAAFGLENVIYFAKIGIITFIGIHIFILLASVFYKYRAKSLEKTWSSISSSNQDVINMKKELVNLEDKIKLVDSLTMQKSVWAMRLNKLSLLLPSGIWFDRLRITGNNLDIDGSVVSLKGNEIEILNNYVEALKADAIFYGSFNDIEIGTITNNSIFGVEIINFSLRGALKE